MSANDNSHRRQAGPDGAGSRGTRLVLVLLVLSLLVATVLLVASFVSFDRVRPLIGRMGGGEGGAETAAAIFSAIVQRLRMAAIGIFVASLLFFLARGPLGSLLFATLAQLRSSARALKEQCALAWSNRGAQPFWTVVGLTAAGAVVRILFLDRPILWDEATTYLKFASRPPWLVAVWYPEPNNHVLHSILASLSCLVFGGEPWALRLPALLAGMLVVPAGYLVARQLYGDRAALLAGCVMAVAPPLVLFSVNARGYSMLTLFFLVLIGLAAYLKDRDSLALWAAFAVTAALGFYALPVMLYPLVVVVAWLAISMACGDTVVGPRRLAKRLSWSLLLTAAVTGILYAPILLISGPEALFANRYVTPKTWVWFAERFPGRLAASWQGWHMNLPELAPWVTFAGFVLAVALHRRMTSHRVPVAAGAAVLPFLLLLQHAATEPRILVFLFPLFVITASAGLAFLVVKLAKGMKLRPGAALALVLPLALASSATWLYRARGAAVLFDPGLERETLLRAGEVVAFLKGELRPGDRVVFDFPSDNAMRYFLRVRKLEAYLRGKEEVRRLLVIVNGLRPEGTVDEILRRKNYPQERYATPTKLLDLESAQVYAVELQ